MRSDARVRKLHRLRWGLCVAIIGGMSIAATAPATAAILDPLEELLDPSPSPTPQQNADPEPDEPDPIRDTINKVVGSTDGGGGGGGTVPGGGGGNDPTPVQEDPGAGPKGSGSGDSTKKATSGSGDGSGGSTKGSKESAGSGNGGTAVSAEASDDESYSTLAARGTVAAAERALKLAGPLAPPLLLGAIALVAVIGLARGSSRLVKLDDTRFPEQTYRL